MHSENVLGADHKQLLELLLVRGTQMLQPDLYSPSIELPDFQDLPYDTVGPISSDQQGGTMIAALSYFLVAYALFAGIVVFLMTFGRSPVFAGTFVERCSDFMAGGCFDSGLYALPITICA